MKQFTLTISLFFLIIGNLLYAQKTKDLAASSYHTLRGSLNNSFIKFHKEKKGSVAFLGGSITQNKGWRDSICNYLLKRFPETKFDFIEAGIGSMGTTSAAFRLEKDVLSKGNIDLLFEEAAVNDRGLTRTTLEQIRGMEGIVRHTRTANANTDIVIMHFVDPQKIRDYKKGKIPTVIQNHEKVANYYHIPTINLAKEVSDRIENEEFTWKDDFKNIHPSPFGQGVYAHSIITFLENSWIKENVKSSTIKPFLLPEKPIDEFSYNNGKLIPASLLNKPKGWDFNENWTPEKGSTRKQYVNIPLVIGEYPTEPLVFEFEGSAVGIITIAGFDAGIIEYSIDGTPWIKKDLFSRASKKTHLARYITLSGDLTDSKHTLQIRLSEEKNAASEGKFCRIFNFYVNQKPL